jgi:protein SCO1/2
MEFRMPSRTSFIALGVALSAWALAMPPALAHDPHAHHRQAEAQPVAAQSARVALADTLLLDQDGRRLRFKSDVVGERIVIVDFIYTTCTTVCPVVSATLAQVQGQLGARLGRDVALLSVTVDPVRDTPARLKDYGARLGAGPGWSWLTGAKPQVDEVLKAFGAYTPNFADHPPLVLVGDAKTGQWLRFYGFPSAEQLVKAVAELTAARAKAGAAG